MGIVRTTFLNAAIASGALLMATGGLAYASPEWYTDLSESFEAASETGSRPPGGRYAGMMGALTSIEPNTALLCGAALLAYGVLVPKNG